MNIDSLNTLAGSSNMPNTATSFFAVRNGGSNGSALAAPQFQSLLGYLAVGTIGQSVVFTQDTHQSGLFYTSSAQSQATRTLAYIHLKERVALLMAEEVGYFHGTAMSHVSFGMLHIVPAVLQN